MDLCPFGSGSLQQVKLPTGRARVVMLYEEYIHYRQLKKVWDEPLTDRPQLGAVLRAGFHSIELSFLLLAEFIADDRKYVAKRARVEALVDDLSTQCRLLTEVIDGEMEEEEEEEGAGAPASGGPQLEPTLSLRPSLARLHTLRHLTLTQPFPFQGCPPTTPTEAQSPCLRRLVDAVAARAGSASAAEQNWLIKLVLNLTGAFDAFQRWSVGLGIEGQLDTLRSAVGLPPALAQQPGAGAGQRRHSLNLDYSELVRPEVVEATLTGETYTHAEDFFFRTVHLMAEAWAFVAHNRIQSARVLARQGRWQAAAARMGQASSILHYLGSHALMLTRMNLRDYLLLKVELEGTSGEGSAQIKAFRGAILKLWDPLALALVPGGGSAAAVEEDDELQGALLALYEAPEAQPELYSYAKALEEIEAGLLGGFYFKHYMLAANVIGSDSKGTTKRTVQGLKRTYETTVFPRLDAARCELGRKKDAELAHLKGRIIVGILDNYSAAAGGGRAGGSDGKAAPPAAYPVSGGQGSSAAAAGGAGANDAGAKKSSSRRGWIGRLLGRQRE